MIVLLQEGREGCQAVSGSPLADPRYMSCHVLLPSLRLAPPAPTYSVVSSSCAPFGLAEIEWPEGLGSPASPTGAG